MPLLMPIPSDGPLMQPRWGRWRDAIADRPHHNNLFAQKDRRDLPRLSGKASQTAPAQRASAFAPGRLPGGGRGAASEMQLCCSVTHIQVRPIAWRTSPSYTMGYRTLCRPCVQQLFTMGRKIRSLLVVRSDKGIIL